MQHTPHTRTRTHHTTHTHTHTPHHTPHTTPHTRARWHTRGQRMRARARYTRKGDCSGSAEEVLVGALSLRLLAGPVLVEESHVDVLQKDDRILGRLDQPLRTTAASEPVGRSVSSSTCRGPPLALTHHVQGGVVEVLFAEIEHAHGEAQLGGHRRHEGGLAATCIVCTNKC